MTDIIRHHCETSPLFRAPVLFRLGFVQKDGEIDIHEPCALGEDAARCHLDAALRRLQVGRGDTTPRSRLVADKTLQEVLHRQRPPGRFAPFPWVERNAGTYSQSTRT